MSLGTTSIDRRSDYYERIAGIIARDPINFYHRAEKGRKIQSKFPWISYNVKPVLRLLKRA